MTYNIKHFTITLESKAKCIDLLKDESLTILNAIPTVEGTIKLIIDKREETIHESTILICGFGRIGKILCKDFKALGANVYCAARKESDFAWIREQGYIPISYAEIPEIGPKIDIIINTVPHMILSEKELKSLKSNVLIVDVASLPGGIDKNIEEVDNQYKKDNITFIKEDIDKIDLTPTYQAIICFETLEHVNNPNRLLKQISKSLTSKGLFLLSVPNEKYEKLDENGNNLDIYHKTIFKLDDLLDQLKNDFKIIDVFGQSKINEIINKNPNLNLNIHSQEEVIEKTYHLAYPNKEKIEDTYSYIIVCQKK